MRERMVTACGFRRFIVLINRQAHHLLVVTGLYHANSVSASRTESAKSVYCCKRHGDDDKRDVGHDTPSDDNSRMKWFCQAYTEVSALQCVRRYSSSLKHEALRYELKFLASSAALGTIGF